MGTYLGFMLAFSLLCLLLPGISWPLLTISWMISATYLYLLPFREWVKTRVIVEATKLGSYYMGTVQLNELFQVKRRLSTDIIVNLIDTNIAPFSHTQTERLAWVIDESLSNINSASNTAFLVPILDIAVTYSIIGLMYLHLKRIDFFRRVMV